MPLFISLVVLVAVGLVVWERLRPRANLVALRLRGAAPTSRIGGQTSKGSLPQPLMASTLPEVGWLIGRLLPSAWVSRVERLVIMADLRMEVFLTLWAAAIAVGVVSALFFAVARRNSGPVPVVLISLLFVSFYGLAPYLFARRRAQERQKQIQLDLPYALDLLVTCMEAGLGVDAAFATVADKLEGPVADAFAFYLRQVGLGRLRRQALLDIGERTGAADLMRLAAVVAQAEEMGASLGDVLRAQAGDLRLLRRQRAEEAAQRAPALMTLPLATCFLPATVAIILVPVVLNLMDTVGKLGGR